MTNWEDIHIKRINERPLRERYYIRQGFDSIMIEDTFNDGDKRGYLLGTSFDGKPIHDDRYYTAEEFQKLLNDLDRKVNEEYYNPKMNMVLHNKPMFFKLIESKLDMALKNLEDYDEFEVELVTGLMNDKEIINCEVKLYRTPPGQVNVSKTILNDDKFMKMIDIINKYMDELEDSDDQFDSAKYDALVELKLRIIEEYNQK